jgi:hypothetical protein
MTVSLKPVGDDAKQEIVGEMFRGQACQIRVVQSQSWSLMGALSILGFASSAAVTRSGRRRRDIAELFKDNAGAGLL